MSRRLKIFLFFLVFLAVGYGISRLLRTSYGIPQTFTDARLQGAIIAQNIVNLSNQSASDLEKINELDSEHNFTEALTITTDVIRRSAEVREQAVALAGEIEKMTKALSEIDSFEARQAALESIANRLALINRLINYSNYLAQLLDVLRNRFTGKPPTDHEVANIVTQINAEVTAINSFNNQAGQAMDRFDKIIK